MILRPQRPRRDDHLLAFEGFPRCARNLVRAPPHQQSVELCVMRLEVERCFGRDPINLIVGACNVAIQTTCDLVPNSPHSTPLLDLRSEEHTSELQSRGHLVCRLLLEKKQIEHTCAT